MPSNGLALPFRALQFAKATSLNSAIFENRASTARRDRITLVRFNAVSNEPYAQ